MTLPTRSGDKASTGVCSCEETIPDPGIGNRDLLRKSWMLLNGNSAENRVLLLLELPCGCAHIFAHKMALLIIAHSSGAFPSRGWASSQEEPHREGFPRSCIPTLRIPWCITAPIPHQNPSGWDIQLSSISANILISKNVSLYFPVLTNLMSIESCFWFIFPSLQMAFPL